MFVFAAQRNPKNEIDVAPGAIFLVETTAAHRSHLTLHKIIC